MSARDDAGGVAVYAEALAQAAQAKGQLDEVGAELATLRRDPDPVVNAFFGSSAIHVDAKVAKVEAAFRGRATDLFTDFLLVLLRRNRQGLLRPIAAEYQKILDRLGSRVPVTLTTAAPVEPADLEAWTGRLAASLGKQPVVRHRVDPALVGGMVMRVGDVVADGSVRRQLNEIRARVASAGHARQES